MQVTVDRTRNLEEAWETIVTQSAMQSLPYDSKRLVDTVARIGYEHARSQDDYEKALKQSIFRWTEEVALKSTTYAVKNAYSTDVARFIVFYNESVSKRERERENMKQMIPLSYVILGLIFLISSFVFGFAFYLGRYTGKYLVGPWTNLMLLIASIGLTVTVVVAGIEWRKLQNE